MPKPQFSKHQRELRAVYFLTGEVRKGLKVRYRYENQQYSNQSPHSFEGTFIGVGPFNKANLKIDHPDPVIRRSKESLKIYPNHPYWTADFSHLEPL